MLMEIKAVMTVISMIFIAIVISQIIMVEGGLILAVILFMAIGVHVFGDFIMGYFITRTHANRYMEKPPSNKEVTLLFTLTGLVDFVWTDKRPHGKREFSYNKKEASVINKGDAPIHLLSGATGFISHEDSDENLNMREVKYAEEISKELGTDDIREVYTTAKKNTTTKENEDV